MISAFGGVLGTIGGTALIEDALNSREKSGTPPVAFGNVVNDELEYPLTTEGARGLSFAPKAL